MFAVCAAGPGGGGVADVFRRVTFELAERGHTVTRINVPRRAAPAAAGLIAAVRARRQLRSANVVHVEFGSNDQEVFWFGLGAVFLGAKVVAVVHDHPKVANHPGPALLTRHTRLGRAVAYRLLAPLLDERLKRQLLRRAAVIAAFSADACAGFEARGARRVVELTHGADTLEPGKPPPSAGDNVLFAGFLGPSKGIDVLLEAWMHRGAETGLPLIVAGGGDEDWIRGVMGDLDRYPVPPDFRGPVGSERGFQQLIENAAIVVLPYRYSSPASGVLVRALAAGRAIITTPVPAARDLEPGTNAIIVPMEDADALGDAIVGLAANPKERDRLGAAALRTAIEHFSWRQHIQGLEAAYQTALAPAPGRVTAQRPST